MKTKNLVFEGSVKVVALACGKCGVVQGLTPEGIERAEKCCAPVKCSECKKLVERKHYTICQVCEDKRTVQREKDRLESSEKVLFSDYKGDFVYHDSFSNDGFSDTDSIEDELDDLIHDKREVPDFVWACDPSGIGEIDATDFVEGRLGDYHEDAINQVDVEGLQKLLDAWVKEQTMVSYFPSDMAVDIRELKKEQP